MRLDDYLLTLTLTMLRADDAALERGFSIAALQGDLDTPFQPRAISFAGALEGSVVGLRAWVRALRGKQPLGIGRAAPSELPLPAHVAEAFAGGNTRVLVVGGRGYMLTMRYAPPNRMTGAQLVAFLDAQACAEPLWARVLGVVNEHLELNGGGAVTPSTVRAWLARELPFVADRILDEVVLATRKAGCAIVYPDPSLFDLEPRPKVFDDDDVWHPEYPDIVPIAFKLRLAANPEPWTCWVFDDVGLTQLDPVSVDAKAAYVAALQEIAAYAKRIDSGFALSFELALRLAHGADFLAAIPTDLDERQREVVELDLPAYRDLVECGMSQKTALGLFSTDTANVFGGMGSWNDTATDAEHERLSSALFSALGAYRATLLA